MEKSGNCGWSSQREHSRPPRSKPVPGLSSVVEAEEETREKIEKSSALAEAVEELQQTILCSRCGTRAADTSYLHWKNLGRLNPEHWYQICEAKGLPLSAYKQSDGPCTWICLCDNCFCYRGGWRNYMGRVPPEKAVDYPEGYSPFSSVGSLDSVGSSLPATGSGSQAIPDGSNHGCGR